MSLQVWLPLNGDLHNQGLCVEPTITGGISYVSNGKIGKAYNDSATIEVRIPEMANKRIWSICFWGYIVSASVSSNWTAIAHILDGSSSLRVEVCPKTYGNGIYCYTTLNNSGYAITNASISTPNGANYYDVWTHCCITCDGTTITKYINGAVVGTCAYNGTGAITGTFRLLNNNIIYKNDVRIYDHCLSQMEVREIAQGLVLHYKLDGITVKGGGANLLASSANNIPDGFNDYTGKASATRLSSDGKVATSIYAITCPEDTATYSNHNIYVSLGSRDASATMQNGKTYTLSFKVKASKPLSNYSFFYEYTSTTTSVDVLTDWTTVKITGAAIGSYSALYVVHGGSDRAKINGGTLYLADIKLEEGTEATPWCPYNSDTLYSTMGYNNTIEYDCSGFGNHLTLSGTTAAELLPPRYTNGINFNQTGYLYNNSINLYTKEFTINFWLKIPSTTNNQHFLFGTFNSWTNNGAGAWRDKNANGYDSICCSDAESSYGYFKKSALSSDVWYMITYVHTGTQNKTYLNAELTEERTYGSNGTIYHPNLYLGNSRYANCPSSETDESSISDFRFYVTALSANDIMNLYSNDISVDNHEQVHAYEFKEE